MPAISILFVDDEPHVRAAIRRSLHDRAEDWELLFAANGAEALDLMAERPVHVVVTDIAMPVMDGKTLLTQLYDRFPEVAAVVLSGHWTPDVSHRQLGPGIRFLSKPVTTEVLVAAICEAARDARIALFDASAAPAKPRASTAGDPAVDDANWVNLVERD